MSATEVHGTSRDAADGNVRMNLEVQIIPVSDADRSKRSTNVWAGGSTTTSPYYPAFASRSSPAGFRGLHHVRAGTHRHRAWLGRGRPLSQVLSFSAP
jgi:hypothetical protein